LLAQICVVVLPIFGRLFSPFINIAHGKAD
jgi:hypothetical protein